MQLDLNLSDLGIPCRLLVGSKFSAQLPGTNHQSAKGEYQIEGKTFSALFARNTPGAHMIVVKRGGIAERQTLPVLAALAMDNSSPSLLDTCNTVISTALTAITTPATEESLFLKACESKLHNPTHQEFISCIRIARMHFEALKETLAGMTFAPRL